MTELTFKAIAAMSRNRVIGKNNTLPWHIPDELQWFKQNTVNHPILMGRKTYESIGRPLPKRETIVLSRSMKPVEGVRVIQSLSELTTEPPSMANTVWVCGGSQVYELLMPYCAELLLTHVDMDIESGDAFFPDFENGFDSSEMIKEAEGYKVFSYRNQAPQQL